MSPDVLTKLVFHRQIAAANAAKARSWIELELSDELLDWDQMVDYVETVVGRELTDDELVVVDDAWQQVNVDIGRFYSLETADEPVVLRMLEPDEAVDVEWVPPR